MEVAVWCYQSQAHRIAVTVASGAKVRYRESAVQECSARKRDLDFNFNPTRI